MAGPGCWLTGAPVSLLPQPLPSGKTLNVFEPIKKAVIAKELKRPLEQVNFDLAVISIQVNVQPMPMY
jgi:hypothetical protein